MKITIDTATNGYIVTTTLPNDEEVPNVEVTVIEDNDDGKKGFTELCYHLADELGFSHNKYKEGNFRAVWDLKGHKLE